MRRSNRPTGLLLAGTIIAPLAVMSLYLGLSRWPSRWFTAETDWAAGALAVAAGVGCIAWLPVHPAARVALSVVYIPITGFALVVYSVNFVGVMFGDWL